VIDASFIQAIRDLAVNAIEPKLVDIDENQKAIFVGGQCVKIFAKDSPFGTMLVGDYSSFVEAVKYLSVVDGQTIITVNESMLRAEIEPTKPHVCARVQMTFDMTAALAALLEWERNAKSVAAVNKLLRTSLHGTFNEALLPIFRQVEFSRSGSTVVTKAAHRDTMGKSVDNAVKSLAGEVPEEIAFNLALYQNIPAHEATLRYFVEANAEAEAIKIAQIGDSLSYAVREIGTDLVIRLSSDFPDALVVFG
jgi:hypothetical protein